LGNLEGEATVRRIGWLAVGLFAVALFAACSSSSTAKPSTSNTVPQNVTIQGSIVITLCQDASCTVRFITDQAFALRSDEGKHCNDASVSRFVANIASSSQVTVKDERGVVIATGSATLADGKWGYIGTNGYGCTMPYTVANVPRSRFYTIEYGNADPATFGDAALAAKGSSVDLPVSAV
jgi:hypothetical protein